MDSTQQRMAVAERRQADAAFTLVEILVVVSTMGLLLALLMPALAAARSQARGVVCQSNLRQLALAGIGYATENDGLYVPAASDMWDNAGLHRWHGVRTALDEPFDPARGPLVGYLADGRVKECPTRTDFVRGDDWNTSFEQGCGGYGYNMAYIGSRLWDKCVSGPQAFQLVYARTTTVNEVAGPGQTVMFADTAMANTETSLIEYSFAEPPFAIVAGQVMAGFYMSPSIHFRHTDRANIGWVDGHTGSEPMESSETANAYGADSATLKLGWFKPVDNSSFDLR
jgi:prepilin-type processing-associated H-X9-DG protein